MKPVFNHITTNHLSVIKTQLKAAKEVNVAVAFLKSTGWHQLEGAIKRSLQRKCRINIFCGLGFGLTESKALLRINGLKEEFPYLKLYLVYAKSKQTFHPKLWTFSHGQKLIVLCGSANFTSGGFENNFECSFQFDLNKNGKEAQKVSSYFSWLIKQKYAIEANTTLILQYAPYEKEQEKNNKAVTPAPPSPKEINYDYERLKYWFNKLNSKSDFRTIFADRSADYNEARDVLDEIATKKMTKSIFADKYQQLVGSSEYYALWHASSLDRHKKKVINQWRKFILLTRFIRANKNSEPAFVYGNASTLAKKIPGVGPNIVTEMMICYNRKDFAILNKNPLKVLIEELKLDIYKTASSYTGESYKLYCNLISEISEDLGLKNKLEADSFFNEVYQKIKKNMK